MDNIFLHLLNMSLTAGILVVAVVLLRLAFYKAPRWLHCLLWTLVAVRLLCPFTIESRFSLMPSAATVPVSALESTSQPPATRPVGSDTPAPSNPVMDTPVVDTPVVDTPVIDTPVIDTPVVDTPVIDTPVVDTPIVNAPVETPSPNVTVSTPAPKGDANPWQTVLSVASWLWLAGMLAMVIYAAVTTLRLRHRVREAARLRDNLWQCDHLRSPFILGVFRPRIYLPSDLDGTARDSVVAHEQAHLHRRDHWWKPLGFLLLTVYWFNPLMWVAYILLCRDIEAACDERVVRNMNADSRRSYSEALLLCSAPRRLVSACPLAFGETSVKSRIKSVLSYKKPTIWIIVAALLVSTVAGVCLLTDPKSDKPVKEPDSKTNITTQPTDPDEDANSADRTAPLGLIHVIRTGMIDTGFIEYFGSSDVQQITSRTDLLAFLNPHHEEDMHWANVDWQISDFDQFDDTFFADNVLLLTYHGTSSGMHTPEVVGYTYSEDGAVLTVEFVEYHPSFVTSDMAAWLMFSGIKKTDLEGVTTVTSHLLKEVPTDTYVAAFTEPTEYPETATEKWREFYEDWAGIHLREMLTRLNDGGWEDSFAINRALNFVGCVWIQGDIYYVTDQFDALMSTYGKVGWLTAEESVRVSWLFDGEEDPVYQLIAKAKKVNGNNVLMECVENNELIGDVWVDFSRFSVSTVKIGEHYRVFYDYMESTDPPRVTPIRVMLAPINGTTTINPTVTTPTPTQPNVEKWLDYTVIVKDKDGNPISGVKISISSAMIADTITTDSKGVAKANLPEGVPAGTIEVPQGYIAASKRFRFADAATSLTIVLEKEQPVTPPNAKVFFNYTAENWLKDSQKEQIFGSYSVVQLASYDEMSSFLRTYSNGQIPFEYHEYDNAFFEEYSLLLTYYQTASGMSKPKVATYTYSADGTTLSVGVDEYWPSGLVTQDIGEWVMLSVIKKTDLEGVTKLTSHLRAKLPSDSISFLANSTADPYSAVGEATKALNSIESDVLNSYLISSMIDQEWGRWTPSSDVLFDVKLVINSNTYFYDIDSGRIIVTDGYMVHTMAITMQFSYLPARTNMIDWVLARYSDANDEVWIWEDFESRYYKDDAQPLNTPEMRAIALRTNWAENNSRNRAYDAQYTIGGVLYLIDMEHEEVLTADEKQVSPLTKEEVAYLSSVLKAE